MARPSGPPRHARPSSIRDVKAPTCFPTAGEGQDARLVRIAAELAAAEAEAVDAIRRHADAGHDGDIAATKAASQATTAAAALIDLALARMTNVPAEGLLGITIKATRLCESLIRNRGDLLVAEEALAASLLADCRRLTRGMDVGPGGGSCCDHPT